MASLSVEKHQKSGATACGMGRAAMPGKKEFGFSAQIISVSGPSGALANCARRSIGNLAHCSLILPEPLDGVPGHRKSTRVLDVNVRFEHLAVLDQVEALDDVKLLGVRRAESVHPRPVIESDRIDDKRIAFVTADGFAIPGWLDVRGMLVRQVDVANVLLAGQDHDHVLRP